MVHPPARPSLDDRRLNPWQHTLANCQQRYYLCAVSFPLCFFFFFFYFLSFLYSLLLELSNVFEWKIFNRRWCVGFWWSVGLVAMSRVHCTWRQHNKKLFNFSFINVAGNLASSKGILIGFYWQSFCSPYKCIWKNEFHDM